MNEEEPYYQIPLSILQMDLTSSELVQHVVSYALVDYGRKISDGSPIELEEIISRAKERLNVSQSSETQINARYEAVLSHRRAFEQRAGRDVTVRLRRNIIWEGLNEGGLTLREFKVLAGIYAALGGKAYGPVSLGRLRFLAAGYKSKRAFEAVRGRASQKDLLTERQVKYTRDGLRELHWFSSVHDGRRVFYSNRLSEDRLKEAVQKKLQFKKRQRGEIR